MISAVLPAPSLAEKPTVSVVIPMYNERENIAHSLAFVSEAASRCASEHEIIVVDDASTDDSPEIVARAAARDPRIRVVRNERNRKLGGTLRAGFAAARLELVLYTDADLPADPRDLERAIRAMRVTRADLVAGYRFDRVPEGYRRAVYSTVYNTLIRLLFRWPCRDVNFAFKLIRRRVLEAIELHAEGSLIDAELVVKAKNAGFVVQQIGLDYFPRAFGESNLASPAIVVKILRELATLYPEMRRPRVRVGTAAAPPSAPPPE
jgi:glycosyltransferase involved in cell wall biosynthesis